jgi:hypothetical protein
MAEGVGKLNRSAPGPVPIAGIEKVIFPAMLSKIDFC